MDFQKFLEANRDKLYKMADDNTKKNSDGIIVLDKDDEWRKEIEWDKEKEFEN